MMEEQMMDGTPDYKINYTSEELLKIKREELKDLRDIARKDRKIRLANNAEMRIIRDENIERINLKLKTIKDQIVSYNKKGKKRREEVDILGNIFRLIENDTGLTEEIKRSRLEKERRAILGLDKSERDDKEDTREVTQKEIEAESVDIEEISPPGI